MNRDQKAAAIAEIAANIEESQAVFAVDYRGITVFQVAELRSKLREADASFRVVKNSLTERAADQTGVAELKELLQGPTALTFVRGDAALAAKAIADYARLTQLLPFKGGVMDGAALDADQIRSISRLPSREVLYGQLVGVVASPVSGLVRTLAALVGGLAVALGQVREKKESGEIPAGEDAPAATSPVEDSAAADAAASVEEASAEAVEASAAAEPPSADEAPAAVEGSASAEADAGAARAATEHEAEPAGEQAQNDNQADASEQSGTAEANPTKED